VRAEQVNVDFLDGAYAHYGLRNAHVVWSGERRAESEERSGERREESGERERRERAREA
jgi:hypothetical protein